MTHQAHFLTSANEIIYLENGEMMFKGSFQGLISSRLNIDHNLSAQHLKMTMKRLELQEISKDSERSIKLEVRIFDILSE